MIRYVTAIAAMLAATPALAQGASPAAQVAAAVAADWPKYDQGGKGHLTQGEFATWLTELRANAGKTEDPVKLKAWADGAFLQADTDVNLKVTPEELTAFLQKKIRPATTAGR